MRRSIRQRLAEPPNAPRSGQSKYEPEPGWRSLLDLLLAEASQLYGLPLRPAYKLDMIDGWFYKAGLQKKAAISDGDAFNLVGLMCVIGDEDKIICGRAPTDKYEEAAAFWRKAAQSFSDAVIAGDIRVWARNGGIAGPFRPVATDTWEKAIAAILDADSPYGPHDIPGWLASCIYWDKLLGVPETELCSFFSERLRESRKTISDEALRTLIEEETKSAGGRLDVRTLKKICAEKCSGVSQERFLEIEKNINGPRERGRRKKSGEMNE